MGRRISNSLQCPTYHIFNINATARLDVNLTVDEVCFNRAFAPPRSLPSGAAAAAACVRRTRATPGEESRGDSAAAFVRNPELTQIENI